MILKHGISTFHYVAETSSVHRSEVSVIQSGIMCEWKVLPDYLWWLVGLKLGLSQPTPSPSHYSFIKLCVVELVKTCKALKTKAFCIICKMFCIHKYSTNPDTDAVRGLMLYFTIVILTFASFSKETDAKSEKKYVLFSEVTGSSVLNGWAKS